tara:strand:- start:196 stop:1542 length:1347 start_codon:yes stop_codon:yes gene_type:complete
MPRFSSTTSFEQIKRARKLPERSHLTLEFPQTEGRFLRSYIPFLQNPVITERGQSNLNEYDLVGRAGSLYSYGGAKSRVFTIQFKINLIHLLYSDTTEGVDKKFLRQFNLFYADKERAKKSFRLSPEGDYGKQEAKLTGLESAQEELDSRAEAAIGKSMELTQKAVDSAGGNFFERQMTDVYLNQANRATQQSVEAQLAAQENEDAAAAAQESLNQLTNDIGQDFIDSNSSQFPDVAIAKGFPHAEVHRTFYREALGIMTGGDTAAETPVFDEVGNWLVEQINKAPLDAFGDAKANTIPTPQDNMNRLNTLLNAVYVWINLIRATTLNNSTNTTQGPPIVRLTHGPMYNNIPCVVSDYNIDFNQSAGYEVETLTPKELNISMTLKEFRTNGSFVENQIQDGDNIAGWEAIIGNNNADPYNGDIVRGELEQFPSQTTNASDIYGPELPL